MTWHYSKVGSLTACDNQNSLMKQMERLGLKEPYRRGSHGTNIRLYGLHLVNTGTDVHGFR